MSWQGVRLDQTVTTYLKGGMASLRTSADKGEGSKALCSAEHQKFTDDEIPVRRKMRNDTKSKGS